MLCTVSAVSAISLMLKICQIVNLVVVGPGKIKSGSVAARWEGSKSSLVGSKSGSLHLQPGGF